MLRTPPGQDQELLRRIAITARRQRCRIGEWPRRIRVSGITWHLIGVEEYTCNAGGRDLQAKFTHAADYITPGAAASIHIEKSQLLILGPQGPARQPAQPAAAPAQPQEQPS